MHEARIERRVAVRSRPGAPATVGTVVAGVLGLGVATLPGPLATPRLLGQLTAPALMSQAVERFEGRAAQVRDYTVRQEFLGISTTVTFRRNSTGGLVLFAPVAGFTTVAGRRVQVGEAALRESGWSNPVGSFRRWMDGAVLLGREPVDDVPAYVIRVGRFDGARFGLAPGTDQEGSFEPREGTVYLEQRELVVRRVRFSGVLRQGGRQLPADVTVDFRDYRVVDGVLHPFRIAIRAEGLLEGLAPEQRRRIRDQLEELDRRLAALSPAERQAVESLLQAQLTQLRSMLADGTASFEVLTRELRVNAGS